MTVKGFAGAATTETFGQLNPAAGSTTVTLLPGAGGTVLVTAAGGYANIGGAVLFRGTNLGGTGPDAARFVIAGQAAD